MESKNKNTNTSDLELGRTELTTAAHQKLDDFISTISGEKLDNEVLQSLQKKFIDAIELSAEPKALKHISDTRPKDLHNDLDQLLFINKLDKSAQKKFSVYRAFDIVIRLFIAVLLIILGFGMIIMPAPPYFEMFTLFYLNPNDGVTIMDVFSLIVAFIGIYILVRTLIKKK